MFATTLAEIFDNYWLYWLVAFVGIEVTALWLSRKHKTEKPYDGGTFSELIWRVTRNNRLAYAVFAALWLYLGYHFFIQ